MSRQNGHRVQMRLPLIEGLSPAAMTLTANEKKKGKCVTPILFFMKNSYPLVHDQHFRTAQTLSHLKSSL